MKKNDLKNKIKLDSMVTLTINEEEWIGQVVELRKKVALIKLMDNMHYRANVNELTPFMKTR
jgi:hypothetical protein